MKKTTAAGVFTAAALTAAGLVGSVVTGTAAAPPPRAQGSSGAAVDPANFGSPRANPWFPIRPGMVTRLRGSDGAEHFRERVLVTHRTRVIQGVTTRVVSDVVRRPDGSLAERTTDWYADDNAGNVWYFGEATATYTKRGAVESREGSWMAGRSGAVAGLIMPANPHATDAYRQEFWRGHAEDQAWIVARQGRVRVPAGTFHDVVRSYEWSRLEPNVVSLKFYAPGVGIIKERDVAGGTEKFTLVSVSR